MTKPQWEEIYQRVLRQNDLVDSFALRQGFMLGWNNGLDWYAQELQGRVRAIYREANDVNARCGHS